MISASDKTARRRGRLHPAPQKHPLARGILIGMLVLLPAGALAANSSAGKPPAAQASAAVPDTAQSGERFELWRRLGEQIRGGNLTAARETARQALRLDPTDGAMAYNLACVEARLENSQDAWAALTDAFARGFTDLHLIENDPDLALLRDDERFPAWLQERRTDLSRTAQARGLTLRDGHWSAEIPLLPPHEENSGPDWPQVGVKLLASGYGLRLAVEVMAPMFQDRPEPWRNGDGLEITLAVPPDPESYESERYFAFGFGLENSVPVGVFIARHGQRIMQRVVELDPKIKLNPDGSRASYSMTIPWSSISPYSPLMDSRLGLNVSYLCVGSDGIRRTVALMPDPEAHTDRYSRRRYVPVHFEPSEQSEPALTGRVADAVVDTQPLEIQLAAWIPEAGEGQVRIEILDSTGQSVVQGGPVIESVALEAGRNRWQQAADMSALATGAYRLRVELTLAGGKTLSWQTQLLRFEKGWPESMRHCLDAVPVLERTAIQYRLDAVEGAVARRDPLDDPSPIGTTIRETAAMCLRADRAGTVLPDSGICVMAYEDHKGRAHPCALRLPPGWQESSDLNLLVILTGSPGHEVWAAQQSDRLLHASPQLVILIPFVGQTPEATPDLAVLDAEAAIRWGRERFAADSVLLAGWDRGAADAMHASLQKADLCRQVLLIAGGGFDPWPRKEQAELVKLLKTRPNQVAYSVRIFYQETGPDGPADVLAAALREAGYRIGEVRRIAGGLSRSQAVSLTTEWALNATPPLRADR